MTRRACPFASSKLTGRVTSTARLRATQSDSDDEGGAWDDSDVENVFYDDGESDDTDEDAYMEDEGVAAEEYHDPDRLWEEKQYEEAVKAEETMAAKAAAAAAAAAVAVGVVAQMAEAAAAAAEVVGAVSGEVVEEAREKGEEYSATMQVAMGNTALVYRHELGMNYARVLPNLIVGSCLQSPADLDHLRDSEGVGSVHCLQRDSDLEYFALDIRPIIERAQERGDIQHVWTEIRDFDPFDLRMQLPRAVAALHRGVREHGTAYVHCTAGLGRAPATALAYMWWMCDMQLEEANEMLQKVRRCGPKLFAIREAACDLLTGSPLEPVTLSWRNRGVNQSVEVAGMDVGWHHRLPLTRYPDSNTWTLTRQLPIGTYYYKHIINGDHWSFNPDAPLTKPDRDNNVNNYVEVVGSSLDQSARDLRKRLMSEDAPLTEEDRAAVVAKINELADAL